MSRVYGLKHATPRMKYVHMNMVLDWRANVADLKANPPDRHVMLEEIRRRMGGAFYEWFADVYKLRSADRQEEYEQAIVKKLRALIRKEKRNAQKIET
jgi:hypothetical protein